MAPVKKVVRWKNRRAFKMPPCHHAFPQNREAQPTWIDILVSHRRWETYKVGSRMVVEWRTATWVCSSPNHSEGVDNKLISRRRCVVVNYLNKFEIYLPSWSRGPIKNIVMVQNMRFFSQWVWHMWFSVLNECDMCDLVYWTSIIVSNHIYIKFKPIYVIIWHLTTNVIQEDLRFNYIWDLKVCMRFKDICDFRKYEI